MITRPAAFRVYGEPAPKGSLAGRCLTHPRIGQICARAARIAITEDANRGRPWRRAIERAAPLYLSERPDKGQPVRVVLLFAVTRTQAAAGRTRPSVRSARKIGGDLDKLIRLVLDALESCGVLLDDAQVTDLDASKVYADSAEWYRTDHARRGRPGLYCRIEPAGYIPPELPYEQLLDEAERTGN